MEYFYASFNTVISLASLAMVAVYLLMAIREIKTAPLLVSTVGLMLSAFYFVPLSGFISIENSFFTVMMFCKPILLWGYYAFTWWFLLNDVGGNKKMFIISAIGVMAAGCISIWFMNPFTNRHIYAFIAIASLIGILMPCVRIALWQYQNSKGMVRWLIVMASAYQIVFSLAIISSIMDEFLTSALREFFPSIHLPFIFFGIALAIIQTINLIKQNNLLQHIRVDEERWDALMNNAPMVILILDKQGRITFINTFGAKLLGYNTPRELFGLDWLDNFLLHSEIPSLKKLYQEVFNAKLTTPTFKNTVKHKNGQEIILNWVNIAIHESKRYTESIMCMGLDISAEESANRMVHKLQQELEKETITHKNSSTVSGEDIIGKSKALVYAIQKARQVAVTHAPVLLEGETGVGKEMFANLIHKTSSRRGMPFIKVNCGALPKELIEDELFGHEKGAFTSAIQARKGRFELANGGTLFLDEIGELSIEMQPKLLRALQSGEFERVGGQTTIKVDVRILAATNRNLQEEIKKGNFRGDLYYRLNVFPITIPPLVNRKDDLPELINYFINRNCKEYGKTIEHISKASLQRLLDYHWPGNIRELKNVIERAVIVSDSNTLNFDWWHCQGEAGEMAGTSQSLEQIEKEHILAVMERCRWKINGENGAAEVLVMHPNTLRSKMKRLGIIRPVSNNPTSVMHS